MKPRDGRTVATGPTTDDNLPDMALAEIRAALAEIKDKLPTITASNTVMVEINADISQIEVEADRPNPRRSVLKRSLKAYEIILLRRRVSEPRVVFSSLAVCSQNILGCSERMVAAGGGRRPVAPMYHGKRTAQPPSADMSNLCPDVGFGWQAARRSPIRVCPSSECPGLWSAKFQSATPYLIPRCETCQSFCGARRLRPAARGRFAANGRPILSKRNSIGNRGSSSSVHADSTPLADSMPAPAGSSRTGNNTGCSSRGSRAPSQARRLRARARRRPQG